MINSVVKSAQQCGPLPFSYRAFMEVDPEGVCAEDRGLFQSTGVMISGQPDYPVI